MDLQFTNEEEEFRAEVRAFLETNLTQDLAHKGRCGQDLTKAEMESWHEVLQSRNWLAANWPTEYGGPGWSAVQRHIISEECALAYAPRAVPFGIGMLGPVILQFGSEEQKRHYLPKVLDGTHWWCQGYSEPGSGSDLASLKTRADRDGDHYVINGQKTWTTLGQHANMVFCLVRTSSTGKPQEGISFLLIDLETPGIEMRPIKLLEGGHEVNEIFFTNARVPVANLVGKENEGWTIAKYLLTHERTNLAGIGFSTADLAKLKSLAPKIQRNGKPLSKDPLFQAEIAELEVDLEALRITNMRVLADAVSGAAPGREASMLKVKGTVIRQRLQSLTRQALGASGAAFSEKGLPSNALTVPEDAESAAKVYFNNRKLSIFGGSNEIQRNIIAKEIFGG